MAENKDEDANSSADEEDNSDQEVSEGEKEAEDASDDGAFGFMSQSLGYALMITTENARKCFVFVVTRRVWYVLVH